VAASKETLETLHDALATKLKDLLDAVDGEAKGAAAVLNVARQFLKDNGIEAVPTPGSPTGKLVQKLNEFPFDPASDSTH
jgi:peptide subunit release factor 1 (eRF1)